MSATHQFDEPEEALSTCLVTTPAAPTELTTKFDSTPRALARSPRPETTKKASGKANTNSR